MPIKFDNNTQNKIGAPQTVEDSIRAYANWSGIHDLSFDTAFHIGEQYVGTAGDWQVYKLSYVLQPEVLLKYRLDIRGGAGHGAAFYDGDDYIAIGFEGDTGFLVVFEVKSGVEKLLQRIESEESSDGEVMISHREMRFNEDQRYLWQVLTIWMNGLMVYTYTRKITTPHSGALQIGLLGHGVGRTFYDIQVPQLTDFMEWSSIDPGETATGGLSRALEGRYVKYFIRYNGALRAWRPSGKPSVYTFALDDMQSKSLSFDKRGLYTHVRMLGAYQQSEYLDDLLVRKYGHRFIEVNNPYLMTPQACLREARREVARMESAATSYSLTASYVPRLELEDRITTPDGDWLISSREVQHEGPEIRQTITARKFVPGEV
jgi:hypothetical protein